MITRMDITPEIAQEWLNKNPNYRKLRIARAKFYAEQMSNGRWQRTEEPICLDTDGNLVNGQHRLMAIVISGVTLKDWPVSRVDPNVTAFDIGLARTYIDYSRANGCAIDGTTSGAIKNVLNGLSRNAVSFGELFEYYSKHASEFDMATLFCSRGASRSVMKKSGCVTAVYAAIRLSLLPDNDIEEFCRIVNSGFPVDGKACESPLALRKTLMEGTTISCSDYAPFCFESTWQAIVAYKRGLKRKQLFKRDGNGIAIIKKVMESDEEEIA